MKDQFANYVVQKVLETCSDQHRELILSRIKVHLNALKKYTYGKHIVARVRETCCCWGRPMIGNNENSFGDDFDKEIGLLLREQRRQEADDHEKELNLYRSGSAPPTVEGSLSAVGGLFNHAVGGAGGGGGGGGGGFGSAFAEFARNKSGNGFLSEEELSIFIILLLDVNLNPRLPPPLLSREDWRFAQRLQGGSSAIGDKRKVNRNESGNGGRSLFSMPPGFNSKKQESENEMDKLQGSVEWGGDGLIGLPGLGLGSKQKSIAELFQWRLSWLICVAIWHPRTHYTPLKIFKAHLR
ncbi:hypothetical protein DH2020_000035 [Rehmannia glutinosa]|uniref:PUM-HD domain-containing protein n=1 Tax=Rehmannia glutinosa TaxID=99300 RepID=A0ABR0XVU1_REHGL